MEINMILIQNGFSCEYDMNIFISLFFAPDEDGFVITDFRYDGENIFVYCELVFEGKTYFSDDIFPYKRQNPREDQKNFRCACTRSFCHAAKKIRPVSLPWGVMSGIRPAKNVRMLRNEGKSDAEIRNALSQIYEVTPEKIELAMQVAKNEEKILESIPKKSVSLYIGIPFCPTRCLYCSFVSTDLRVSGKYMDDFFRLLLSEIEKTEEILKKLDFYVDNIYIGGGTPTTLSAVQLCALCQKLSECFDFQKIREFTLEAGRPDTITREKLFAAKTGGVNRISINPQTMNERTLKRIGRAHSPKMVKEAFFAARDAGFSNINMDLIAGLPGETPEMFQKSIEEVLLLDPENVTVHSMCVKRAANLRFTAQKLTEQHTMDQMLSYAQKRMRETGREPYYMYRQKNISGNLENVGYAKKGFMSFYNVNIMEEAQTIIALGGGGTSKLISGDVIERVFNFKDPSEYIRRFDEILRKKNEILNFFKKG